MRSSKSTKLYAGRDNKGQFEDIQTDKRTHGADIKRKAKGEAHKKRQARSGAATPSGQRRRS